MRASRLVNIMLLLEMRRRVTAKELAAELEVSVRTIHRDVEALSAGGVPVYAERGAHGGIRLLDGYPLNLGALSDDELAALRLLAVPGVAAELGWLSALASARLKLLAALPGERRGRLATAESAVLVDAGAVDSEQVRLVQALAGAVRRGRAVTMTIDSEPDAPFAFEPLGVVRAPDGWHVVGASQGILFALPVASVLTLTTTSRSFDRPASFDLAAAWSRLRGEREREAKG